MAFPPGRDNYTDGFGPESPDTTSESSSPATSPPPIAEVPAQRPPPTQRPQLPPQSMSSTHGMTASSTPLGSLNAARRPGPALQRPAPPQQMLSGRGGNLPPEMAEKLRQFHLGRQGPPQPSNLRPGVTPPSNTPNQGSMSGVQSTQSPKLGAGGVPSNFQMPPPISQPRPGSLSSSMAANRGPPAQTSLAAKRGLAMPGGLSGGLSGGLAGRPTGPPHAAPGKKRPGLTLSSMNGPDTAAGNGSKDQGSNKQANGGSLLDKYSDFIDKETGSLKFKGKATLTNQGVEFTGGKTFNISLDEVDTLDELGKGNYGTVYKVRHSRPRIRRPGLGLAGNKAPTSQPQQSTAPSPTSATASEASKDEAVVPAKGQGGTTGIVMAMKEIRLELDDAKFAAIIMELDVLHRCVSPFIVDFYGAFFQEGAVYICLEFMDGGSVDKIYGDGVPEGVLRKITLSTVMGLKSLKDEHNIIHRDVKPTNILINTKGQIKICDFGVSGNLVASIAKTNIGCQSYMAPERISSGGVAQAGANPGGGTYSVQSDIWSLGLSIIECALGRYPYPPETYDNIFSQLSAIVDGEPPDLPADRFSDAARNFVSGCLMKIPKLRPTYAMLLQHAWLAPLIKPPTISEEDEEAAEAGGDAAAPIEDIEPSTADKEVAAWVIEAIERKRSGAMGKKAQPALHAAPLDAVSSPAVEKKTVVPVI